MNQDKLFISISNAGKLEIFGIDKKPWRECTEPFLKDAIDLAKTDATAALALASKLVANKGITGIVRFRCSCPAEIN